MLPRIRMRGVPPAAAQAPRAERRPRLAQPSPPLLFSSAFSFPSLWPRIVCESSLSPVQKPTTFSLVRKECLQFSHPNARFGPSSMCYYRRACFPHAPFANGSAAFGKTHTRNSKPIQTEVSHHDEEAYRRRRCRSRRRRRPGRHLQGRLLHGRRQGPRIPDPGPGRRRRAARSPPSRFSSTAKRT